MPETVYTGEKEKREFVTDVVDNELECIYHDAGIQRPANHVSIVNFIVEKICREYDEISENDITVGEIAEGFREFIESIDQKT